MISLKPKEIIPYLEEQYNKHGLLTFVDGYSYYEGCGVGGLFYYVDNDCLDIPRNNVEVKLEMLEKKYKIITRQELDNDKTFPIKKVV